jgi:hypothetical protein
VEYFVRIEHENDKLRRNVRETSNDNISEVHLNSFLKVRALNALIFGPVVQEVGIQFAKEFEISRFSSIRWMVGQF